jgi:hypothetical protein
MNTAGTYHQMFTLLPIKIIWNFKKETILQLKYKVILLLVTFLLHSFSERGIKREKHIILV